MFPWSLGSRVTGSMLGGTGFTPSARHLVAHILWKPAIRDLRTASRIADLEARNTRPASEDPTAQVASFWRESSPALSAWLAPANMWEMTGDC